MQNISNKSPEKRSFVTDTRKEIVDLHQDFQKAQPQDMSAIRFMDVCRLEPTLNEGEFSSQLREIVDDFAQKNSLNRIGQSWSEVSEKTARWVIEKLLGQDLAYGVALLDPSKLLWLSQEFVWRVAQGNTMARTGKGCRYFINGESGGPSLYTLDTKKEIMGWQPVTDHTFDKAIVMVTPSHIGIIWGWGED